MSQKLIILRRHIKWDELSVTPYCTEVTGMPLQLEWLPVKWIASLLGECMALWGEPNELSIQYHIYIFIQYVDS